MNHSLSLAGSSMASRVAVMLQAMKLELYQWLVPLISIVFIVRTVRQFRNHHRARRGTIIWIAFWVALILLSVLPDFISNRVATALGFKSNINAVIFVALGFLFVIVFYLTDTLSTLERKMTELVRELAIERAEKEGED